MLLLFDIDGTLIRVGGAGRRALTRAFSRLLGVVDAMQQVRLDGRTDLGIIEDAFRVHLGRSPKDQAELQSIIECYLEFLDEELIRSGDNYQVMNGARAIAAAACSSGRCAVGLATGNVERGARKKLEKAGLNASFAFGGFGSDSAHRPEVVARGIERGQKHALVTIGRQFAREETFVIGDTELDVHAARTAGAVAVGVLAGCAQKDALIASKPDILVESLESHELWDRIGLARGDE